MESGRVISRESGSKIGDPELTANWMRTHMRYPRIAGGAGAVPKGEGIGRAHEPTPTQGNMRPLFIMLLIGDDAE